MEQDHFVLILRAAAVGIDHTANDIGLPLPIIFHVLLKDSVIVLVHCGMCRSSSSTKSLSLKKRLVSLNMVVLITCRGQLPSGPLRPRQGCLRPSFRRTRDRKRERRTADWLGSST
jgi:hypothetical protein